MDIWTLAILFLFGLAVGSFFNVVALRYEGERFVFDPRVIGGRSYCSRCRRTLKWYELIPVLSFAIQGGRCRHCGARIGFRYPIVELVSGIIFAAVPFRLAGSGFAAGNTIVYALWIAAFELLLLVTYIDIRLQIVPDELTALLGVVAIFAAIFSVGATGAANASLLAPYSGQLGMQGNVWLNRIAAAAGSAAFFAILIFATRGKGMGWGDAKLAFALGLLFGWPDVMILVGLAFVFGALAGGALIMAKRKSMKSAVPFVPFLASGAAFVFFFGAPLLGAYLGLMGI